MRTSAMFFVNEVNGRTLGKVYSQSKVSSILPHRISVICEANLERE